MKNKNLILPVTGGIDSTTLLYLLYYGYVVPESLRLDTPVYYDKLKLVSIESNIAIAGRDDVKWFTDYFKTEECKKVCRVLTFRLCKPGLKVGSFDYGLVEGIISNHEETYLGDGCIHENEAKARYTNAFIDMSMIPALITMVDNPIDDIFLGFIKDELCEDLIRKTTESINGALKLSYHLQNKNSYSCNGFSLDNNYFDYGGGDKPVVSIIAPLRPLNKERVYWWYKNVVPEDLNLNVSTHELISDSSFKFKRWKKLEEGYTEFNNDILVDKEETKHMTEEEFDSYFGNRRDAQMSCVQLKNLKATLSKTKELNDILGSGRLTDAIKFIEDNEGEVQIHEAEIANIKSWIEHSKE